MFPSIHDVYRDPQCALLRKGNPPLADLWTFQITCRLVNIQASVVAASVDGSQQWHEALDDIIPQVHLRWKFLSVRLLEQLQD